MVNFTEGILKLSNVFLSLIAGAIALSLLALSAKKKQVGTWRLWVYALVLFAILEIFGALRAFNIFESPFITHIIPTVILGLIISALIMQINTVRYCK